LAEHAFCLQARFACSQFAASADRCRNFCLPCWFCKRQVRHDAPGVEEAPMNGIIYLVGLIVVIMFILSLLGLR